MPILFFQIMHQQTLPIYESVPPLRPQASLSGKSRFAWLTATAEIFALFRMTAPEHRPKAVLRRPD
ncbi:hypothetical protein CNY67_00480 [Desulfovibrio sp. G11]|nr:hypothetical protein CNY67_00480 [Desulfovibrio sp. G11]